MAPMHDCTIRVRDAHTGDITAGPFDKRRGAVNSVAFSSPLTVLASALAHIIAPSACGRGLFKRHTGFMSSVTFSPDGGNHILSVSNDKTVQCGMHTLVLLLPSHRKGTQIQSTQLCSP